MQRLRSGMQSAWADVRASQPLRARIARALDEQKAPSQSRLSRWLTEHMGFAHGAWAGAAAAMLAVWGVWWIQSLLTQTSAKSLLDEHLLALRNGTLTRVLSSDHHTVKPWFAGRTDVSPRVGDFKAEDFVLLGGRTASVHGQQAAVMVYRHGLHIVDLYAMRADRAPPVGRSTHQGYGMACWREADIGYCAVSDVEPQELERFVRIEQELARRE